LIASSQAVFVSIDASAHDGDKIGAVESLHKIM